MKKIALFIAVILTLTTIFIFKHNNDIESKNDTTIPRKMLTMNLEQTIGKGDYKEVAQSSWPSEGYIFNSELSRCENGSTLTWDNDKKQVIFSGNVSDKCYVYFDVARFDQTCNDNTLACYTAKKYTGTQGKNNIYYHNSNLSNGAGDNSYRYAGASEEVNNFVCFGSDASTCPDDNLYRIIGVIDEKVKLIKWDYANSNLLGTNGDYYGSDTPRAGYYKGKLTSVNIYYWNYKNDTSLTYGSNTWSTSLLNKTNLNTNYINNIGAIWANRIETTTWKVGGNTSTNIRDAVPSVAYKGEVINPVTTNTADNATTYDAKIGLMYVSDYGFAAIPSAWTTTLYSYTSNRSVNWMYMGGSEWTISRISNNSILVSFVDSNGFIGSSASALSCVAIRPVFNLTPSVTYTSGTGTQTDPIRIN